MKYSKYKLTLDTGKIVYVKAKSRGKAIEQYCAETGTSKEWMRDHCKVENLGLEEATWVWKKQS